jgi:two-component system, OmpR family, sensor histidine kinase KdpD
LVVQTATGWRQAKTHAPPCVIILAVALARNAGEVARPNPDALLRQLQVEERAKSRGRLKVFLGYASGVGKSFRMLDEGRRRRLRGEDVVVAAVQPSSAEAAAELLRSLEVIPPPVALSGPAIDVEAVRRRRPQVVLVDGLAYDNPPGSRHAHRWQDVEDLLASGISVITSVNLHHVAERQPAVEAIRGKSTRESIPESFLRTADEIEVVDAPAEYCLTRSLRGGAARDGEILREERQLSELREMALILAAEVVDHQLGDYLRRQGRTQVFGTHERILVGVTSRSNAAVMIRRARRQADRFHGDLHVVYVEQEGAGAAEQARVAQHLEAAREAKAQVEVLHGRDPVRAIIRYARAHGITQIFVGHSDTEGLLARFRPNRVQRLVREAEGIDVRIFPRD